MLLLVLVLVMLLRKKRNVSPITKKELNMYGRGSPQCFSLDLQGRNLDSLPLEERTDVKSTDGAFGHEKLVLVVPLESILGGFLPAASDNDDDAGDDDDEVLVTRLGLFSSIVNMRLNLSVFSA